MKARSTAISNRKTRSGCITCSRVKCDEQKPSCLRCLTTQRICEGYLTPLQQTLSPDSLSDEERRAFLFFRSRTAHRIFGHRDVNNWLPILLQLGHNEAPVRYTITALASLHESVEPGNASVSIRPSSKHAQMTARMLALRYYTSAINSVQTESHTMSSRPDIVLTLCILFLCFEQFRSGDAACLVHLKSGFKLLYWWRSRTATYNTLQEYSRPALDYINNQITPTMQRLRVQFSLCMDSRHALKDLGVPLCLPLPPIPSSYTSLNNARNDFDRVMNYVFSSSERGQSTNLQLPQRSLTTALRQWKKALDSSDFSTEPPLLRECTYKLLELYFHVSIIITETYSSQSEAIFDQYTESFQKAVDLAASLTKIWRQEQQGFSLIFSFDLGLTPPMFLIASRCRHPVIRRRAVNLMLESPFYHGAWQDRYSGLCARRILEIEEEDALIVMDQINVLDEHRVRKVAADLQEEQSQILMQFIRWPFTLGSPIHTTVIDLQAEL
ncbi:hypothetical protein N7457_000177 [Penicillium paradoxum]|uniref:uncharacterized protein n=1 Tax=Penicillium paradoxum TaxID=176176 RepID=UPI002547FF22|nr:uncharacterized protein N7457_000177 [Penicillium paradoxum]KAJ5793578.1 hypothetical protein N7457_000177 [Penicillium paradoxum]